LRPYRLTEPFKSSRLGGTFMTKWNDATERVGPDGITVAGRDLVVPVQLNTCTQEAL
jgi:hypothetical protein